MSTMDDPTKVILTKVATKRNTFIRHDLLMIRLLLIELLSGLIRGFAFHTTTAQKTVLHPAKGGNGFHWLA